MVNSPAFPLCPFQSFKDRTFALTKIVKEQQTVLMSLQAISPIDGRYQSKTQELIPYFSEEALIRYRLRVEVEYFIALTYELPELSNFNREAQEQLRSLYWDFSTDQAKAVKETEKTINHDVKAIEYHLKSWFDHWGWEAYREFVHFGLTSQDINNTAIPLMLKEALYEVYIPFLENHLLAQLSQRAREWQHIPMPAHTHGQPATPTTLGKELQVFVDRLTKQLTNLKHLPFEGKFGGASGNFNAHVVAYPEVDWLAFGDAFLAYQLGLERQQFTTQIDQYDHLAAIFDALKRINTILLDLARDGWSYISMEYLGQQVNEQEVGSSVMPHKVNPIDFENAEGNLGLANSYLNHLSEKLPVSRLQRDLSDSTVIRNIGMPISHGYLAFKSLLAGLRKVTVNEKQIRADLNDDWSILAEPIQTHLRKVGYPNPYETLKAFTRKPHKLSQADLEAFVDSLDLEADNKAMLKALTPENYTGTFPKF